MNVPLHRQLAWRPSQSQIESVVADDFGVDVSDLFAKRVRNNEARAAALFLIRRFDERLCHVAGLSNMEELVKRRSQRRSNVPSNVAKIVAAGNAGFADLRRYYARKMMSNI